MSYLLETVKNLIVCAPSEELRNKCLDKICAQIKSDLYQPKFGEPGYVYPAQLIDVNYLKQVVIPLLHSETPIYVSMNILDRSKIPLDLTNEEQKCMTQELDSQRHNLKFKEGISPIISLKLDSGTTKSAEKEYFLKSEMMNSTMLDTLSTKMVEMRQDNMPEVKQMVSTQWEKIYEESQTEGSNNTSFWTDTSRFKEFVLAVEDKSQMFVIVKAANNQNGGTGNWP